MTKYPLLGLGVVLAGALVLGGRGAAVADDPPPPAAATSPAPAPVEFPCALCFTPEMEYIPEADQGAVATPDDLAATTEKVQADWATKQAWLQRQATPEVVRALSRWAKPQMESYAAVPSLAKLVFAPVRIDPAHRKATFEATVDTLPSHHPTVTRRLKLLLLCDQESGRILRVTITIRGQRLE